MCLLQHLPHILYKRNTFSVSLEKDMTSKPSLQEEKWCEYGMLMAGHDQLRQVVCDQDWAKVAAWAASWSTSPLCHLVWNPAHSHSAPWAEGPELTCAALAVLTWSCGDCNGTSRPQHNRPRPPWCHHRNTSAILSVQSSYWQPHLFAGSHSKLPSVWFLFGSSQLGLTSD